MQEKLENVIVYGNATIVCLFVVEMGTLEML